LNDEQQRAVDHQEGPAIILAGAGSGKTATMTMRVRELIERGVRPNRICCVTFTNKAANELLERLGFEEHEVRPRVGTIHGLALSMIRRDPTGFGLGEKVSPIDDWDQKVLVDTIIDKLKMPEDYKAWPFLDKTKFHRARGVGFCVDYTPEVHQKALKAYGGYMALSEDDLKVWKSYEKEKARQSVLDFDDMIHLVVRRGNSDGEWLAKMQKQFDHIMVDEAQDTNVVQWAMINNMFRPDNYNGYFVGDLSQSIYAFTGAAPELLHGFTKDWRGKVPALYKLERNHRSVPEVVALANRIQKTMTETVPLRMSSFRGEQGEQGTTGIITSANTNTLAAEIALGIDRDRKRMQLSDIAILVRSGSLVKDIEPELVKRKIPYVIRGASGFLQSAEVRDVLSYLRVAVNHKDYPAFQRSATNPKRGVGDVALEALRKLADESFDGDLIEAARSRGSLLLYNNLIDRLSALREDPLACLEAAIEQSGYEKYLREKVCKKDKDRLEMKLSNLQRLHETFENITSTLQLTLEDIVFQLAMNGDKDFEEPGGKVIISTIHSSKGLEWKRVYVFGVVEGQMPHKLCQSEREIEEERRIAYVACTRARDQLILGIPGSIKTYQGYQLVAPSRFLYEWGVLRK
jgi:DNA helicase-2/ATP-dependent DNA helicase PcrA